MADTDTPDPTDQQTFQQKAIAEMLSLLGINAQAQPGSLQQFIFQFFNMFFGGFLSGNDAPNEEGPGGDAPDSTADVLNMARSAVTGPGLANWKKYKDANPASEVNYASPVAGAAEVTSPFGHRDTGIAGASTNHKGVDIGARGGSATPDILAAADGVVIFSGRKSGFGNAVIIGHADGSTTLYGHMQSNDKLPPAGAFVKQGTVIGTMGKEGISSGYHLHFEVHDASGAVIHPKVMGVALAVGNHMNGATQFASADAVAASMRDAGTPAAIKVAANTPPKPAATKPATPAPTPAVAAQVQGLHLPKFDVAEAYQGAKTAISNSVAAIGSVFRV